MKYSGLVLAIIITLITSSCNWLDIGNEYKFLKGKKTFNLGLNRPGLDHFHPIISVFNQKDITFLYYFSKADTSIRLFSINKEDEKIISSSSLFKTRINYSAKQGVYIFMESSSLVWIDSPVSDSLYQIDLNNLNILQSVGKTQNKDNLELYDFMNQVGINSEKNELILGIFEETDATFGLFEIRNNSLFLKNKLGHLPDDYKNKEMYIDAGMFTKINADSFLISYYFSDSVDLYANNTFVKRVCLKSDSSLKFTGFEGDMMDVNAIKKFFLMNQRYNNLFYDSNSKLYYRVFSFEKESLGKIEESEKWSICIFDRNFKKIHEEVFNIYDYYKGYVLLINSNLYIANAKKSLFKSTKDSSTITFENFVFEPIED